MLQIFLRCFSLPIFENPVDPQIGPQIAPFNAVLSKTWTACDTFLTQKVSRFTLLMTYFKKIGRYLTNFGSKKVRKMALTPPYPMKNDRYFTKFYPKKSNIGQPYPIPNWLCPGCRGYFSRHIFMVSASLHFQANCST